MVNAFYFVYPIEKYLKNKKITLRSETFAVSRNKKKEEQFYQRIEMMKFINLFLFNTATPTVNQIFTMLR